MVFKYKIKMGSQFLIQRKQNMDYKTIMKDKDTTFDYSNIYENTISTLASNFVSDKEIEEKLASKRKYGREKYKEFSFQNSFENSINVPIIDHAEEEIIDLLNYLLHMYYVNLITYNKSKLNSITSLICRTKLMYKKLQEIKEA